MKTDMKIKYEIFRLITPLMLTLIGTLLLMLYNGIDKQVTETAADNRATSISIAAIQTDIADIKERLDRDEAKGQRMGALNAR